MRDSDIRKAYDDIIFNLYDSMKTAEGWEREGYRVTGSSDLMYSGYTVFCPYKGFLKKQIERGLKERGEFTIDNSDITFRTEGDGVHINVYEGKERINGKIRIRPGALLERYLETYIIGVKPMKDRDAPVFLAKSLEGTRRRDTGYSERELAAFNAALASVVKKRGIALKYGTEEKMKAAAEANSGEKLDEAPWGSYALHANEIVWNRDALKGDGGKQARVILHELAHASDPRPEPGEPGEGTGAPKDRKTRQYYVLELFAELASYLVSAYYGIEDRAFTFSYGPVVSIPSSEYSINAFRERLPSICEAARDIIRDMDRELKERGIYGIFRPGDVRLRAEEDLLPERGEAFSMPEPRERSPERAVGRERSTTPTETNLGRGLRRGKPAAASLDGRSS